MDPEDKKMLTDIHTAMVGNDLGTEGLINRMKNVETKVDCNKKSITNIKSSSVLYGTAAGGGATALWVAIKTWWIAKFGG